MACVPNYQTPIVARSSPGEYHSYGVAFPDENRLAYSPLIVVIIVTAIVCFFALLRSPTHVVKDEPKSQETHANSHVPKLLLVSYDGFRWDYLQRAAKRTPTFDWLIKNGVYSPKGIKNTFITKTAPNHYGIATGLYEESHGIIANTFFDPLLNETFNYFTTKWKTDPRFFSGEPIWVTNERQSSSTRRSGCIMWVGCDVKINGYLPTHYISFNVNLPWHMRVDSLISWFKDSENPINLGILYIEEPDLTGHYFGPDAPEVSQMVQKLDNLTGYLMRKLKNANIFNDMNIVFTSDHGMTSIPWNQVVNMDKYINSSLYTNYGDSPNWNILSKPGKEEQVNQALQKLPHVNVYNKSNIPEQYHYRNSSRIMPVQVYADLHWHIANNQTVANSGEPQWVVQKIGDVNHLIKISTPEQKRGHGYNNSLSDMHPYFIAIGPAFKIGYQINGPLETVDLYTLMCHILAIKPAPNNGSFHRVKPLLRCNSADCQTDNYIRHHPKVSYRIKVWHNYGHMADFCSMLLLAAFCFSLYWYWLPKKSKSETHNNCKNDLSKMPLVNQ